jgi:hypothetical protein
MDNWVLPRSREHDMLRSHLDIPAGRLVLRCPLNARSAAALEMRSRLMQINGAERQRGCNGDMH